MDGRGRPGPFKERVAGLYRTVDPDNVLQANGATGANLLAIMALVEPGDHVVAEYPTYQPLYELPRSLGADVDYWRNPRGARLGTRYRRAPPHRHPRYQAHLHQQREQPHRHRAIARHPQADRRDSGCRRRLHPVGRGVPAARGRLRLRVDRRPLRPRRRDQLAVQDLFRATCASDRPASNAEVAERIRVLRDYTMICGGVFNDAMAVHVLDHRDQIIERNRAIILEEPRHRGAMDRDEPPRASWVPPRGVSTSYLRLDIPVGDEEFCLNALENAAAGPGPRQPLRAPVRGAPGLLRPEGDAVQGAPVALRGARGIRLGAASAFCEFRNAISPAFPIDYRLHDICQDAATIKAQVTLMPSIWHTFACLTRMGRSGGKNFTSGIASGALFLPIAPPWASECANQTSESHRPHQPLFSNANSNGLYAKNPGGIP